MENPFKSRLFFRSFLMTMAVIVTLFAVMLLLTVPFIQDTVESIEVKNAKITLNNVFDTVENLQRDIDVTRATITLAHKKTLSDVLSAVASRASALERQVAKGTLGHAKARRMFLDEIKDVRYGNNDYVWAADYRSVLISHPDPALDNADFSTQLDQRGNLIVPPMVAIARAHGAGYHSYWWRRLGQEQATEKLSYSRHIPFFDLVIGTGIHVDDIEATIQRRFSVAMEDLRQQLRKTPLGKTGYLYIFDSQGNMLIHPNANIEGKSLAGMIDQATKQELTPLLKAAADKPEGVRYQWDSPSDPGNYIYEKISWVRYVSGFDWYIGSSVYTEELAASARTLRNRLLGVFAVTLLLCMLFVYLFVAWLVNPLKRLSATARFIENGDLDARCRIHRDDEIGVVAAAFNGMVGRLQDNIRNLDAKIEERTAERERANEERWKAEKLLCESEDYNKMLFQESHLAMVVLDPSLGCIDCNLAALKYCGISGREEIMGMTLDSFSTPAQYDGTDSASAAQHHVSAALAHGVERFEWRCKLPGGEIVDAMIHLMAFNYRGRQLLQFTIEDITEQKRAEAERKKLDQLKSDFLSSVSHELRTPTTSVVGFAKLVKKRLEEVAFPKLAADDKTHRVMSQVMGNIEIIVKESEHLSQLISDVLDITALEAGKIEWTLAPLSPSSLLERVAGLMSSPALQKGIGFSWQAEPGLPDVLGDESRLMQVLSNLVSNAIKFTMQGSIAVSAEKQGAFIQFCVRDTGIGISEDDRAHVFDKFRQVGDTLTNKPPGTGLGLPICHQIIKRHGGEIWLDSVPGVGSAFFFTLPIRMPAT